jgi:hypothetical protein
MPPGTASLSALERREAEEPPAPALDEGAERCELASSEGGCLLLKEIVDLGALDSKSLPSRGTGTDIEIGTVKGGIRGHWATTLCERPLRIGMVGAEA